MKYLAQAVATAFGIVLTTLALNAQTTLIEPCRYGQDLIDAVRSSYSPNQTLGYGPARDILYSQIDNVGNDLYGIYTNFKVTLNPNDDPSQSAYQNGQGINAEHVYPQSKGAGNEPMRSDMHNIYPSKVNVNSSRGSCPFGEINDAQTDYWFFEGTQLTSIPSTNIDAYSEKDDNSCVFEPRESKKGDIARAIFYFYAVYQNVADAAFFHAQKQTLLAWHYADAPDADELARSAAIAQRQGNENPFALDTTLARRAFFLNTATYPSGDPRCFDQLTNTDEVNRTQVALRSTIALNGIRLTSPIAKGQAVVYNTQGQPIYESAIDTETYVDTAHWPSGMYFVRVQQLGRAYTFKCFVP